MKKIATVFFSVIFLPVFSVFAASGGTDTMDLFLRVINFSILFGVIFYFSRKPLAGVFRGALKERTGNYFTAREEEKNAQNQLRDFEEKINKLSAELEIYKEKHRSEVEFERKQIIKEAELMAKTMQTNSERFVQGKMDGAKDELVHYVIEKTVSILKKELADNPNLLHYADMNERFISDIKNKF